MTNNTPFTGTLFIVAAPSGAGKTSLVSAITQEMENLTVSVSHTTRLAREGETNGLNYHFVDQGTFLTEKDQDLFLEYAEVFGNYYGTSKSWVEKKLNEGIDVILEIDWQGALQVMEKMPCAISIFILPPSMETLLERLNKRGQDSETVVKNRMNKAVHEISQYIYFHYLVVNQDFKVALQDLHCIIRNQRLKKTNQQHNQQALISKLLS